MREGSLEELRARMPALHKRQTALRAQLDALDAELHDAEAYLKLADTLEGFLDRLARGLDQLTLDEQRRILRLVVRDVLIGGDDDTVTIRHSIPTPKRADEPSYPLRRSSDFAAAANVYLLGVRPVGLPAAATTRAPLYSVDADLGPPANEPRSGAVHVVCSGIGCENGEQRRDQRVPRPGNPTRWYGC